MKPYHKIQTVFNRDPQTNHRTLLEGEYSLPEFDYLRNNMWVFTEKVDGTNIRVIIYPHGTTEFRGKTDNAQLPPQLMKRLGELFPPNLQDRLAEQFPVGACLYGEGYGAGIQKGGGKYRTTQDFVLFDVFVDGWWLERKNVASIATQLALDVVPVFREGILADLVGSVQCGITSAWGDFPAEGLVARPKVELFRRNGERIITKLKAKDFATR